MKITTTTTTTEKKEIEITFPCFTKVVGFSTAFFCIKSENEVLRVEQYAGTQISTFSNFSNTSDAFKSGFDFISKDEFMQYYQDTIDQLYVNYSILKSGFIQDDRTNFEIEQERKEAEEQSRVDDYCDKSNEY